MKKLNPRTLAGGVIGAVAVAAALAMVDKTAAPRSTVASGETGKEKCFGITMAGENACASQGGHTCAGLASLDYSGHEWALVASGTCLKMGGQLHAFDGASKPPVKNSAS